MVVSATMEQKFWHGPLPPPQTLEEFRAIGPDWPERIFQQWEQESQHRRAFEERALKADIRRDIVGQVGAIAFALSALALSAVALWLDKEWVAVVLGGGTIASVVGAFLKARSE